MTSFKPSKQVPALFQSSPMQQRVVTARTYHGTYYERPAPTERQETVAYLLKVKDADLPISE